MSLKNLDVASVLLRLADKRIEDAMKEGKFDKLAGAGQPLELEPMPANEDARLTWWCLRILRNNDFTPDEVRWRKAIDRLKDAMERTSDETIFVGLVRQVNQMVHRINTLGTNALSAPVVPLDETAEIARFHERKRNNRQPG